MLAESAMIVRLSVSQFLARKVDKDATREVARQHGVSDNVGAYRKVILDEPTIQELARLVTKVREYHYARTLPWDDQGGRLLPMKVFDEYTRQMRGYRAQFEKTVKEILYNYAEYVRAAKRRLKSLYKEADYPSARDIEGKYNFDVELEPVPESTDIRVKMQDKDRARVEKEMKERAEKRQAAATADLFRRVAEVTAAFSEKLSDTDAIFRDSLVENIAEVVDLLPKLNIANDPKLDEIAKAVRAKLLAHEPDTLRKDKGARKKAAKDAAAILKKMSVYTGHAA